jgi:class 3 adenylate cyclase/tetratricopeptide (TPR) repeat protein
VIACPSCGAENREEARFCDSCGAALAEAAPVREVRKTVTVLFCDVTGSTALGEKIDPESLRHVMSRYFETAKAIVERHGGTVEKFIGDAVMAVFGVPTVHEDDALRAVRAAEELRRALVGLNQELRQRFQTSLELRMGVNTGEVVTGTEERLATGDAVNVAARLEQAAQPGEILLGAETLGLVRDAVEVEEVPPVEAKGKSERLPAVRLVGVSLDEAPVRRHAGPMVGRERQRRLLEEAFANVVGDRACHLFTILGTAGVGKSRLVAEFLGGLGEATVVSGRCLSYGEGISYWPVTEVAKQLGVDASEVPELAGILGDESAAGSADEIAWAFRRLLEARTAERPLVVVFDDIHWGEPTFLDLVEHVSEFSRDAPILLLCMARPELLERRPTWGGGKLNATTVLLEPLGQEEAAELLAGLLLDERLDAALRARILDAADGNPFFVEEMVAMVAELENGDGAGVAEIAVPPSIQALLAARLDQLESPERVVLERGAVEGDVFHRGGVEALAPEEREVRQRLMSLVRKELVRPDDPQLPGDDAFRFRHHLIREAAYDALPKSLRADLHELFAAWLERSGAALVELDELVGYHLEQACRYRAELGTPAGSAVANEARRRLAEAGLRALRRQDLAAGLNLIERALALVEPGAIDLALEVDRFAALYFSGRTREASEAADDVAERAAAAGDRVAELSARLEAAVYRLFTEPQGAIEVLTTLLDEAMPVLEASGDDVALAAGHFAAGMVDHLRARWDAKVEVVERAQVHARRAGLARCEMWITPALIAAKHFGSAPPSELLTLFEEKRSIFGFSNHFQIESLAMLGRFDEARAVLAEYVGHLTERGAKIELGTLLSHTAVKVEQLAGDYAAAVVYGEEGCALLEEIEERGFLSTSLPLLGQALYELGRLDEAEAVAAQAAEIGASEDVFTQVLWRQVTAKVLARRGKHDEAERLGREALATIQETEMLDATGDAFADLAEVFALGGKTEEAAGALEQAAALYGRKGNIVSERRTRERLAELHGRLVP